MHEPQATGTDVAGGNPTDGAAARRAPTRDAPLSSIATISTFHTRRAAQGGGGACAGRARRPA